MQMLTLLALGISLRPTDHVHYVTQEHNHILFENLTFTHWTM